MREDTTVLLAALETFQSTLDEDDEDLPPELAGSPPLILSYVRNWESLRFVSSIPDVAVTYIS